METGRTRRNETLLVCDCFEDGARSALLLAIREAAGRCQPVSDVPHGLSIFSFLGCREQSLHFVAAFLNTGRIS